MLVSDPQLLELDALGTQNISIYSFGKNLWVAINSPSRLIGTGLGTHEFNHDTIYFSFNKLSFLNREDGYSLAIRIFSELGFAGLTLTMIFFIYWFNPKNVINISISFLLLAYLIRGGHYVANGTIFFTIFYYYTSLRVPVPNSPPERDIPDGNSAAAASGNRLPRLETPTWRS